MIPRGVNPWHILTLAVLVISLILTTYNVHYLHVMQKQHLQTMHPESADCTIGGGPSFSTFAKVNQIEVLLPYQIIILHLFTMYKYHINTNIKYDF